MAVSPTGGKSTDTKRMLDYLPTDGDVFDHLKDKLIIATDVLDPDLVCQTEEVVLPTE